MLALVLGCWPRRQRASATCTTCSLAPPGARAPGSERHALHPHPHHHHPQVIKSVRSEVLGTSSDAIDGKWDVAKVMKMAGEGVDVSKALEEPQRRNLFRREFEKVRPCGPNKK